MSIRRSCVIAMIVLAACAPAAQRSVRLEGITMGTTYEVRVERVPQQLDADALWTAVDRLVQSVDAKMSTYDPHSELSRFNAAQTTEWFPVSQETCTVVALAQSISSATGGAFDVTVGPLVDLWGFGPRGPVDEPPTERAVGLAREFVGHALLQVRRSPPALRKLDPQLAVDLSALAKGFAVDEVARHLDRLELRDYLVELGGELRAGGRKASGDPWRVAIEEPPRSESSARRVIAASDLAVATSGSYLRSFEHAGRRYSHILDPRTGRPAESGVIAVTLVAPSAAEADAYATALMVMSPIEGMDFARRSELAVRMLFADDRGLVEWISPRFESSVALEEGS